MSLILKMMGSTNNVISLIFIFSCFIFATTVSLLYPSPISQYSDIIQNIEILKYNIEAMQSEYIRIMAELDSNRKDGTLYKVYAIRLSSLCISSIRLLCEYCTTRLLTHPYYLELTNLQTELRSHLHTVLIRIVLVTITSDVKCRYNPKYL